MPPKAAPVGNVGAASGAAGAGGGAALEPSDKPLEQAPASKATIPQIARDKARLMEQQPSKDHIGAVGNRRPSGRSVRHASVLRNIEPRDRGSLAFA
jgi:hypothetical protein